MLDGSRLVRWSAPRRWLDRLAPMGHELRNAIALPPVVHLAILTTLALSQTGLPRDIQGSPVLRPRSRMKRQIFAGKESDKMGSWFRHCHQYFLPISRQEI